MPEPEKPQPTARYKVMLLKALKPDETAQFLSQRLGIPTEEAVKLVAMAPIAVADNLDPLFAEDLVVSLKGVGANAEKRIIPSSVNCPFHKDQPGKAVCRICGKVICALCLKAGKGQPLCPDCRGEKEEIKVPFPWFRLIIFLILIGVAGYAYYIITKERAKFPWDRPYKLAVVGFMVELPAEWHDFIVKFNEEVGKEYVDLRNHTLPDMVGWFQREYERYGGTMNPALELTIFGPFDEMEAPPAPPSLNMKFLDRFFEYRKFKEYFRKFNQRHQLDLSQFDGVIYVQFVPGTFDTFLESYASRRDNIALVNCFLDINMVETDIMIVIHEFMHLLNAQDHYGENMQPTYPQGFVGPFEKPLYPQKYAEIMAGSIPVSDNKFEVLRALKDLRVGIYTAYEIGWINEMQLQSFIQQEQTPPMK